LKKKRRSISRKRARRKKKRKKNATKEKERPKNRQIRSKTPRLQKRVLKERDWPYMEVTEA